MLTSQHEGILLNGKPFTDMSKLGAVRHEDDFCPVCEGGVCKWVIATREWYITQGVIKAERFANLTNPRIVKTEAMEHFGIASYYQLNPVIKPKVIFGLRTKVRKGVNSADAKRQAQQFSTYIRTVHTSTLSIDESAADLSEEDSFEEYSNETRYTSGLGAIVKFINTHVKPGTYGLTPAQAKRLRKKANKAKSGKSVTTKVTASARKRPTILNAIKALASSNTHTEERTTKLFVRNVTKANHAFNITASHNAEEGFMRDGVWIGDTWDSLLSGGSV